MKLCFCCVGHCCPLRSLRSGLGLFACVSLVVGLIAICLEAGLLCLLPPV